MTLSVFRNIPIFWGLLIAGAIVPLSGCSSQSSSPLAPSAVNHSRLANDQVDARKKKPFEILTARKVVVKVQSCVSGSGEATFSANGKAKGHYRGKFSLTGAWNFVNVSGESFWTFAETFEIKGRHPITGSVTGSSTDQIATCNTFGPVNNGSDLSYKLGTMSGYVTTPEIKNGAKFLHQLH